MKFKMPSPPPAVPRKRVYSSDSDDPLLELSIMRSVIDATTTTTLFLPMSTATALLSGYNFADSRTVTSNLSPHYLDDGTFQSLSATGPMRTGVHRTRRRPQPSHNDRSRSPLHPKREVKEEKPYDVGPPPSSSMMNPLADEFVPPLKFDFSSNNDESIYPTDAERLELERKQLSIIQSAKLSSHSFGSPCKNEDKADDVKNEVDSGIPSSHHPSSSDQEQDHSSTLLKDAISTRFIVVGDNGQVENEENHLPHSNVMKPPSHRASVSSDETIVCDPKSVYQDQPMQPNIIDGFCNFKKKRFPVISFFILSFIQTLFFINSNGEICILMI